MNSAIDIYVLASAKAKEIEAELKRLNRWSAEPLPSGKLENMGAFSSNTMAFEQWLQFILIPRIHAIVEEKGEFPKGSPFIICGFVFLALRVVFVKRNNRFNANQKVFDAVMFVGRMDGIAV